MARTQIRLDQVTGSFGDFEGGIVDSKSTAASLAAIPEVSGSLVDALSHMASAIKRIHGGSAFTTQAAGVFAGRIQVDDATDATSTSNGSLQTDGGLSVVKDAVLGNDVKLLSDAAVLNFGADSDVNLTHVADTGLLLNDAMEIQFRDSALTVGSTTDGQLDINADAELAITAPIVDIDASTAVRISNDLELDSDAAVLKFGADGDVTLTHVADTALRLNAAMKLEFRDGDVHVSSDADGYLNVQADTGVNINIGGTDELAVTATASTFGGNIVIPNGANIGSAGDTDAIAIAAGGDVTFSQDVIVTGDLVVNGATTVVDSTNLQVEDPIILMGSGSAGEGAAGDRGLIMAIASETNPAMFWDESADQFAFVRTNASATDTVITPDAYADLKVAALEGTGATFSGLTDNRVVIAGTGGLLEDDATFTYNGTQLTVGSSFNVQQASGVARLGAAEIGSASDRIDLSGVSGADLRIAAAADLKLEAAGGQVYITGSLVPSADSTYALGENTKRFQDAYMGNAYLGGVSHYDAGSGQVLVKSGSGGFTIKNSVEFVDGQSGAAAANGAIAFQDAFLTGSGYSAYNGQIPLAITKAEWTTFQSNFGEVSLVSAINAARSGTPGAGKATKVRTGGTLAAQALFAFDSGFDHQSPTAAQQATQVDVFVNGQLLLSGALGVNDYTLDGLANNQVKFSFALENDDVVVGIIR